MTEVAAREGENIESLMKRFKKAVERSGVLAEYKKHQSYEKPSVKKKRKKEAAKKKAIKRQRKNDEYAERANSNKNFNRFVYSSAKGRTK